MYSKEPINTDEAAKVRRLMRQKASELMHTDPLYGMLADLELSASPYFLGLDYDEDDSDIDMMGPF